MKYHLKYGWQENPTTYDSVDATPYSNKNRDKEIEIEIEKWSKHCLPSPPKKKGDLRIAEN